MVIDFAQNYVCSYQDEVQSAHWSQRQVTLYAAVTYVTESDEESSATNVVNMVAISPDMKHDAAVVYTELFSQALSITVWCQEINSVFRWLHWAI